jgi:hypothetical protein
MFWSYSLIWIFSPIFVTVGRPGPQRVDRKALKNLIWIVVIMNCYDECMFLWNFILQRNAINNLITGLRLAFSRGPDFLLGSGTRHSVLSSSVQFSAVQCCHIILFSQSKISRNILRRWLYNKVAKLYTPGESDVVAESEALAQHLTNFKGLRAICCGTWPNWTQYAPPHFLLVTWLSSDATHRLQEPETGYS